MFMRLKDGDDATINIEVPLVPSNAKLWAICGIYTLKSVGGRV